MKTIKLFATLRTFVGDKTLEVPFERGTVHDLIAAIGEANPALEKKMIDEAGELSGVVHILVNGRNIMWLDGMETPVGPQDDVALVPPAAGG